MAQNRGFADEDVIVNIPGDQPLIDAETIDNLVRPLVEDKSLVMSTMSYRITNPGDISNPAMPNYNSPPYIDFAYCYS